MKTISLADGTLVPHIAFGSGTALLRQDCTSNVLSALEAGFRHIDTAQRYENEEFVGKALRTFLSSHPDVKRTDLFITTKFLSLEEGQTVEESLRGSLQKLGLDYVDSFLIHAPIGWEKRQGGLTEVWREMVEVKRKGLARTIGVSNFNRKQLEEVISIGLETPAVNQVLLRNSTRCDSADHRVPRFRSNTISSLQRSSKPCLPSQRHTVSSHPRIPA